MTEAQKIKAIELIGTMPREDIAETLGVSTANLKRSLPGVSLWYKNGKWKNQPDLVKKVMTYYEKHGKPATVKKFPEVNVGAIVERPEYYGIKRTYRQIRWNAKQIEELAQMGGLVSMENQAKYFKRPRANAGSIRSVWTKKFGLGGGQINGMSEWRARMFVTARCPRIKTEFYLNRTKDGHYSRTLCLWVDMEKHLKADCPEFVSDAVKAMAQFQRWLFQTNNPKRKINQIIKKKGGLHG